MSHTQSLTLIFPAYNEAENIRLAIHHALRVVESLGIPFEIIAVNDGSHDGTDAILEELARTDSRIRWIHHPRNRGYGAALKSGIEASRNELIFFTDADLQFDLAELPHLLEEADSYDIIAGYRVERRDGLMRNINAWGWGWMVGTLFDLRIRDIDCAFKLFHRRVFDTVRISSIGAFVNSEILIRARAAGFSIHQLPVSHFPRPAGQATGAHPKVVVRAFIELMKLYGELTALPSPDSGRSVPLRTTSEAKANR